MRVIDISCELFSAPVYPGDPEPHREILQRMELGEACNLSGFYACCHSATHVDAPRHFVEDGKTIDELEPEQFIGPCTVAEVSGILTGEQMDELLPHCQKMLLLKGGGTAFLSQSAAFALKDAGIRLVGTDASSIAIPEDEEIPHKELLGAGIPLLEGLFLENVLPGDYTLVALPLLLKGAEAAPVRAVLLDTMELGS